MYASIVAWLTTLTFIEVMIVIVVCFIIYMVYKIMNKDDYCIKMNDIRSKHKGLLWGYISNELEIIEGISMSKAENIISRSTPPEHCGKDGYDPKIQQLTMFGFVLERVLHSTIFNEVKTAIRLNGFHDISIAEMNIYITDKAEFLLRKSRKLINERYYLYPLLRGTDDERFTLQDSEMFYRKIIEKAISVKNDETKDLLLLKKQYSVLEKINFIKRLYKKFNN